MKTVATDSAPRAIGPYSQAVVVNGMVYTSGQIPLTADGRIVSGDIGEQTEQVIRNLRAVLEAAGASLANVVKTTVFLKDMQDFEKMNEVYEKHFSGHKPARSCVEVSRLPKDVRIEIEAVAFTDR